MKQKSKIKEKDNDDYIEIDGVALKLPPDFHELEEIDYNDPQVKKWRKERDERFFEKFGYITHEELFAIEEKANKVQEQNPKLKFHEAVDVVLKEIKFKKGYK